MVTLVNALCILVAAAPSASPDLRKEFEVHYGALADAVAAKDVSALQEAGYRWFDAKPDGNAQGWRRTFRDVESYGSVSFEIANVERHGDDVVVDVRRRVLFTPTGQAPDGAEQFGEAYARDRWRKVGGRWQMIRREDLPGTTTGRVLHEPAIESPRLRRLRAELAHDKAAAEKFWRECEGKSPLIEAVPGDAQRSLVTFLWRGDASVERIEVRGGPSTSAATPFERLADTDVWYRSERAPNDSRFVYGLIVARSVERRYAEGQSRRVRVETYPLDPLNPRTFNGGPVVELPAAPEDQWHKEVAAESRGRLARHKIESAALGESRGVAVYTPKGFDRNGPHALAVFLDGEEAEKLLDLPTVLDNLVAAERIPPTVALLVDAQGTRGRDLVFSDQFVTFLADELVPWVVKSQKLNVTPRTTLIGGASLGGLTAAYAAQQRPNVFGNVLSQSGSYWRRRSDASQAPEGWLPGKVATRERQPVRYYLEVGRFEAPSMVENNRRLRDVLRAKGNDVVYDEYHGGHDHFNWRVSVGQGIIALLGQSAP